MGDIIRSKQQWGIISQPIMRNSLISIGAKSLYAYLASFAGNSESAFPGRSLICQELHINKDSFSKYRWELQCWQIVQIEQFRGERNQYHHNLYILDHFPTNVRIERKEFEINVWPRLRELIESKNKKQKNKNPQFIALSPCPKIPDTVTPDTVKPDTNNNNKINKNSYNKNNNNDVAVLTDQIQILSQGKNSKVEEIIKIFDFYHLDISKAKKALIYLENLEFETITEVAKMISSSKQVKNPIGLINSDPVAIVDSILKGNFYYKDKKRQASEINNTTNSEYVLYIPP